ncbi:MAG: CpsD/CapB family tyrosine-protein kinase, partial [Deltaproteobacteria bacterium]|nr:CpsD/CapB family tyrosine-protein kinase [Deltaproteobacteria bacterium]
NQMAEAMQASPAEQSTPTLGLLNTTLLKSFDLDLQRVAMSRKMDELANAGDRIREAIGATRKHEPGEFAAPAEATRDESRQSVQEVLGAVLPAYGTGGVLLDVVADAQPPVFPEKSTRKKLAIAAALGIFLLGAIGVGWRPILCPSARSAAELALRARVQVLGSLPRVPHVDLWSPLKPGTPLVEARRLLADRVRSVLPGEGIRILLTSPGPNDGRTLVATHLATALGLRGERVMLVDACVREPRPQVGLESLVTGSPSARGLGEFLSGDDVPLLDLARCTGLGRVLLVPRGRALESPEPLGSTRMKTLLGDASRAGSVVIVVGDPLLRRVDAELVARSCNATILAVRAGRTHVSDVRRAIKRMSEAGAPVIGAVLVAVREPFMEID